MSHNASQFYNPDINNRSTYDVIDAVCDNLERAGFTITEREEYPHQDHHTLTLHGIYRNRGIFLNVQFDYIRGAFDGHCAIDTDETYIDAFGELQHKECDYSLEWLCEDCIEAFGVCRPGHIVSAAIDYFNHNINR